MALGLCIFSRAEYDNIQQGIQPGHLPSRGVFCPRGRNLSMIIDEVTHCYYCYSPWYNQGLGEVYV